MTTADLRAAWRRRAGQAAAQAGRFLRVFGAIAVPTLLHAVITGSWMPSGGVMALVLLLAPSLEVAWRQLHPTITASQVDAAPGVIAAPTDDAGQPLPPEVPPTPDEDAVAHAGFADTL